MIYIATHKTFDVPKLSDYIPLQVGSAIHSDLGYARDNDGCNISEKNPNFCELTGLYWIWKNTSDEYKGLVHYRRYFGKSNMSSSAGDIYTYDALLDKLSNNDIVLPYVEYFLQDAHREILVSCCTEDIFQNLRAVVLKLYPQYINAFDAFFRGNKCTLFNMMFCRAQLFDQYCEWLFAILFELEKQVDLTNLNDYQKRLFGFLSERLLNVWVLHNGLKVRNVPVINTEMKAMERLNLLRRRCTNSIRFWLHNI